ncbi:MAG: hypothetical protein ACI8P0_006327 [Planctomycetaceae bacterium]|jgi:hypothetical protein
MRSDTIDVESVELAERLNTRSGTRNLATSSGETRSQLFQRLRSECVWDDAERLKEQVRTECRNRRETKREAGISAWNAIAKAYPPADAGTWRAFVTRSLRAPGISTAADVNKKSALLAATWTTSMMMMGGLATRCSEIFDNCAPLLSAVDARLSEEPRDALVINETAIRHIVQIMIDDPRRFVNHALNLFVAYESTGSPYTDSVANELRNLHQILELSSPLLDERWPRVTCWLWGTRSVEVVKYLTRACETTRC